MNVPSSKSLPAWLLVGGVVMSAGCNTVPDLPGLFDVALSATDRMAAATGSGPAAFANSTWSLSRKADPFDAGNVADAAPPGPYGGILSGQGLARPPVGERIFLARFGANGEMQEVTENRYFLAEIYGETVRVGEAWNAAALPGVSFRSASYGTQNGDRVGLAVVVDVRFLNTFLGSAILYAWGRVDQDRLDGRFGYLLDFTGGAVAWLGTVADQYPVTGQKVGG